MDNYYTMVKIIEIVLYILINYTTKYIEKKGLKPFIYYSTFVVNHAT